MKKQKKRKIKWLKGDTFEGSHYKDLVRRDHPELPSPETIAQSLKNARISIILDDGTISFFKKKATHHGVSYQQMIRQVLRHYVDEMKKAA